MFTYKSSFDCTFVNYCRKNCNKIWPMITSQTAQMTSFKCMAHTCHYETFVVSNPHRSIIRRSWWIASVKNLGTLYPRNTICGQSNDCHTNQLKIYLKYQSLWYLGFFSLLCMLRSIMPIYIEDVFTQWSVKWVSRLIHLPKKMRVM